MVQLVLEHWHERLIDKGRLAAAAHSAHPDEASQGEVHVKVLEVVAASAAQAHGEPVAFTPSLRYLYALETLEVVQGDARRCVLANLRGAVVADLSTQLACAGAHVNYPVRLGHGLLVMLHYYHAVALVAEFLKGRYQFMVVLLVQAYGGLVQDVEDVHQLGADLRGEAYALALAS